MPDHAPLTVTLTALQAEALSSAVASGEYPSVESALADAMAAWAKRDEQRADDLLWMKARIRASLADPDPDLSTDEVEERLKLMFARTDRRADEAA